ncbi:hypothetical protein FJTKL_12093 [Diaporthe vaccinii]|uniref:Uncharacterized protein n=1 Tax=Diaporthe vaccinii TaxID=105482 RepID=A0ABR4EF44_9PEZI
MDVSIMFVSKMRALEEVRQEYREVKEALRGYFQEPLIARGIMKENESGSFENVLEITEEDDETIKAFSRWLNAFQPVNCESYCCLS